MTNVPSSNSPAAAAPGEIACTYHVLRYTPNLVRDEWVNIGILLFNSATGERRLRLIEDEEEYRRVRRLHPQADQALLRALQLASQKGVFATDLDAELERLYSDHVAVQYSPGRVGAPGSRARVRSYCSQVFRQAQRWERIEKSVRVEKWTLPGDPLRID
jgi:Protein of unknown function (DUF3037)